MKKTFITIKKFKPKTKKFGKIVMRRYRNYQIVSQEFSLITLRQLEALRKFISRYIYKKFPKISNVYINKSLFKKSSKARMGKGAGKFFKFYGVVLPGVVVFEFSCYYSLKAVKSKLLGLSSKLPFKFKLSNQSIFFKFRK